MLYTAVAFVVFLPVMQLFSIPRVLRSRRSIDIRFLSVIPRPSGVKAYNHLEVEKKWQTFWESNKTFEARRRPGHPKKYVLDMFPYPSGSGLHVGHPEGYTATDIMSRYWRMRDFDVLHPMGWDAFGLPAEQHAINTGTHPRDTTYTNIATFKRQLKSLGFSYDWSREISTTDVDYVKWTQWIFLQLFKAGLAQQSEVNVNWCSALGTVLANEEIIDGKSERGSHPVIRIPLRQWVFKITQYADKLEEGLKDLQWPDGTLQSQKLWIGRSEGANVNFGIDGLDKNIEVFTTRVDTLLGASYVVLAPEHPLVKSIVPSSHLEKVQAYQKATALKSDLDRTGVGIYQEKTGVFTGAYAIHPLSGEKLPIWIADYVLATYGTGAVMAVPAHDERDFSFASQFDLPIKQVVAPVPSSEPSLEDIKLPFTEEGVSINCGEWSGLSTIDIRKAIVDKLCELKKGNVTTSYKLRDWVFSRQRYWGEPIPIYFPVEFPESDGVNNPISGSPHVIRHDIPIPVEESELPLKLPEVDNYQPGDDPQGCLARAKEWRYFQKDGQWYARETNTMPQWAGSCWYYLRFVDPRNSEKIFSSEAASWLPVDLYVGGSEHAVLHLLYARFWHKALYDLGVVRDPEPFTKLVHQGMILGSDGEKMSKSRGNVINPDDVVQEYGADVLRLYEMFMGPLEAVKPWQTSQVTGVQRFRDRVYQLCTQGHTTVDQPLDEKILKDTHKTIKKVTEAIETMSFNTAISSLMVYSHAVNDLPVPRPRQCLETLALLLSPFAPHVAEECWNHLGNEQSLAYHPWPSFDPDLTIDSLVSIGVQINGKVRASIQLSPNLSQEDAVKLGMENDKIMKALENKEVCKVIYVPGKILGFVTKK